MEFDRDAAEPDLLAIGDRLRVSRKVLAIAQPHHVKRFPGRQHRAMAGAGMVGMAMGDDGTLDRPYRVDVEASLLAAQAGRYGHQDVLRAHLGYIGHSTPIFTRPKPMPARLFLSSGDLIADRRYDFARDLQMRGDLPAAADLLLQAIELAPNFASAWFTLGEIRAKLGERDAAVE